MKARLLDLDDIFDPDRRADAGSPASVVAPDLLTVEQLPPEWHFEWDERAAIMEFDGGLPRERAEALALKDVVARMHGLGRPPELEQEA